MLTIIRFTLCLLVFNCLVEANYSQIKDKNDSNDFELEKESPKFSEIGVNKEVFIKKVNKRRAQDLTENVNSNLDTLKKQYNFNDVSASDYGPIRHRRLGTVLLHSGVVKGFNNIHAVGDYGLKFDYQKASIWGDMEFTNLNVYYKVNARLQNIVSIKNLDLHLWLNKALLNVLLEFDLENKTLTISEAKLKSIEGYGLKSGKSFLPLNSILKNQEQLFTKIIKAELKKYVGTTIQNVNFKFY